MGKPVVALVGRPNVGKSTLFNRIIGRNLAVVHDRFFIGQFATRIWSLSGGVLTSYLDLEGLLRSQQPDLGTANEGVR